MKVGRLCGLTLISLLWLLGLAAQVGAQTMERTHNMEVADTASGYSYMVLYSFGSNSKDRGALLLV
jgi:hypothetical protein